MVRLLLSRNVDVNLVGKNGLTPLHMAAHYKHTHVALTLLDHNADPHAAAKVTSHMLQYFRPPLLYNIVHRRPIPIALSVYLCVCLSVVCLWRCILWPNGA